MRAAIARPVVAPPLPVPPVLVPPVLVPPALVPPALVPPALVPPLPAPRHGPAPLRFPSEVFRSAEAFRAFRDAQADLLDTRYGRERALGSREDAIRLDGTCGLCLAVTRFRSSIDGGEGAPDGRRVPNWREQQVCGCPHRLGCRERALLHLAALRFGPAGWFRAALLGEPGGLGPALAARLGDVALWPRLSAGLATGPGTPARLAAQRLPAPSLPAPSLPVPSLPVPSLPAPGLPAPDAALHMLLCPDHLHHVPALDAALGEAARVLCPGGALLFTVPFHADADATASDLARLPRRSGVLPAFSAEPVHRIGWDILERVRGAGFVDCAAHCYWSEELGYLGPFNMIFLATR